MESEDEVFEGCVGLLDEVGGRPPPPDGGCAPPPLTSRMDGATLQHPILSLRGGPLGHLNHGGGPLHPTCAQTSNLDWTNTNNQTSNLNWGSSNNSSQVDWTSTLSRTSDQDLFELLNRLQSNRLDDQRCTMPGPGSTLPAWSPSRQRLESVLRSSPPYPMVVLPPEGGFWVDPSSSHDSSFDSDGNPMIGEGLVGEHEDAPCRTYRAHFLQSEHFNFCGLEENVGPMVLSVKYYTDLENQDNHIRIILRLTSGTMHKLVGVDGLPDHPSPILLARMVSPDISISTLQPVLCPRASELLLSFDEHVLVNNFKFGVVYQRIGQTTEEALFGNRNHSPAMERFLESIGKRVLLSEHSGYRGGLDTQFGQTGDYTFYTAHQGKEVMFHVATLLPFSETDTQQLQRKRHIGNDIVSLVFQEGSTPFTPDMVTSHFLHSYIVVQPVDGDRYRVTVTARGDVPYFGPSLPSPPIFKRGPEFREWLLCKLINAETACYKAEKFSKLEQRTRTSLLANLVEELTSKTSDFLGIPPAEAASKQEKAEESGGIFKSVKKAFASRTKSQALPDMAVITKALPKSKSSTSGFSASHNPDGGGDEGTRRGLLAPTGRRGAKSDSGRGSVGTGSVTSSTGRGSSPISSSSSPDLTARMCPPIHSESDTSSLNSMEYDQTSRISPKKRTSMSGEGGRGVALDPACQEVVSGSVTMVTLEGNAVAGQLSKLQDEVSKLKVDKLELLRQNVAAQREVKRLRERELQLQSDLTTASREINRLRVNLKQTNLNSSRLSNLDNSIDKH